VKRQIASSLRLQRSILAMTHSPRLPHLAKREVRNDKKWEPTLKGGVPILQQAVGDQRGFYARKQRRRSSSNALDVTGAAGYT
jgi:hypothetical protein